MIKINNNNNKRFKKKIFILSHCLWSQTVLLQYDKMWFYLYLCGVPSVYYICNWMIFTSFGKFSDSVFSNITFVPFPLVFFWIYTYMLLELFTIPYVSSVLLCVCFPTFFVLWFIPIFSVIFDFSNHCSWYFFWLCY